MVRRDHDQPGPQGQRPVRSAPTSPPTQGLHARYAEALSAYRRRDWAAARTGLTAALEIAPGDGPSQALLAHIDWWTANPPAKDWTGAWHLADK